MGVFKCNVGMICCLLVAFGIAMVPRYMDLGVQLPPPPLAPPAIDNIPQSAVVEDTIHKNRTLVATLVDYEVPAAIATEVADLIKPVFDLRKLRFGNPFRIERRFDGTLKRFEYKIDDESVLKVQKNKDAYEAKVEKL